ncbi:MAG: Jag N-terminal domain-containing protein [Pseudomonadota bacterium]|nr:Jag N-terminal domain-containing protein [Pseudomonadota bacterium]
MSKTSIQVEGKTVELALVKAKSELGVPQDKISYRVLRQTAGIASLFSGRKVELEVWRKQDDKGATRGRSREIDRGEVDVEALKDELTDYCRALCELMCGRNGVEVSSVLNEERLVININDDKLLRAAEKNNRIYEALEHLLRKKPRHLRTGLPFRIFVDINGVRVAREDELVRMAHSLADKVVSKNEALVMDSMNSRERRLVHMALGDDSRIRTKSVGNGFERTLMILPRAKVTEDTLPV